MALLYQSIMNVPGLTGSAYQRQKQLYERLGSPQGPYSGSAAQNNWLVGKINSGQTGVPTPAAPTAPVATTPAQTTQQALANQYAEPAVKTGTAAAASPKMGSMTSYWDQLIPQARASATQVVDPEVQRGYNTDVYGLLNQLANTGAGSFGRGWGQLGQLGANTIRNREAQIQDTVNAYQQGFEKLWYDPTLQSWTSSLTNAPISGNPPAPSAPQWTDFASTYGQYNGNNSITGNPQIQVQPVQQPLGITTMGGMAGGFQLPNAGVANANPMFNAPAGNTAQQNQQILKDYGSYGNYNLGYMPSNTRKYNANLSNYGL